MQSLTKNQIRKLNNARYTIYYRAFQDIVEKHLGDSIYSDLAKLYSVKTKYSDFIYDMLLDYYECVRTQNIDSFKELTARYLDKVDIYELLASTRIIITRCKLTGPLVTLLSWCLNLFITLKVGHPVVGVNTVTGEVFVDEHVPTFVDLLVGVVGYYGYKHDTYFNFPISEKDVSFIHDLLVIMYGTSLDEDLHRNLKICNRSDIRKVSHALNYLYGVASVNSITAIYNTLYKPYDPYSCLGSREPKTSKEKTAVNFFRFIIETCLSDNSILLQRNRLLKDGGVGMSLTNCGAGLDSIEIYESHDFKLDTHYIVIDGYFCDGNTRRIVIDIKEPIKTDLFLLYEDDFYLLFFVLMWFGLYDNMVEIMKTAETEGASLEAGNGVRSTCLDLLSIMQKLYNETGITYTDPTSWNYTGTKQFNKSRRVVVKKEAEYEYVLQSVGAYIRRLPVGAKASDDRIELARKYLIELPKGYTLVDGFDRTQKVRIKEGK